MRTDAGSNRLQDGRAGRSAFLVASAVNAVAAIYHIIGGTPEVMYPVYSADLPPASAGVLDILWVPDGGADSGRCRGHAGGGIP
jgi:hypothetical protein